MKFPPSIFPNLQYYVYRLIDPRNGRTFYVGKGTGNRVFEHVNNKLRTVSDQESEEDSLSLKLRTIGEIRAAGHDVIHTIHRHGMNSETAYEVEAALIDCYAGLTNISGGHHNNDRGTAHSKDLISRYQREEAPVDQQFIAINVSRSLEDRDYNVYDAVRFCWIISDWRRNKRTPVAAYANGIILDIFEVEEWLPDTDCEFDDISTATERSGKRWGFKGRPAMEEKRSRYRDKRLPEGARSYGSPLLFLGPEWTQQNS